MLTATDRHDPDVARHRLRRGALPLPATLAMLLVACHGGDPANVGPTDGRADAADAAPPAAAPLLYKANLVYAGAFRVPEGFAFGRGAISYNPANHSLFMVPDHDGLHVAEIDIPAVVDSTNLDDLNQATYLQQPVDPSEGHMEEITMDPTVDIGNGSSIGGMLIVGDKLLFSDASYYDAGYQAYYTHFTANADWGDGSAEAVGFSGMQVVAPPADADAAFLGSPTAQSAGFVAGYMGTIPAEWQAALGGSALAGNGCVPIISRTSLGPSAFAFDPTQVGVEEPVPATPLAGYPNGHWTIGQYDAQALGTPTSNVNQSCGIGGVVFPEGTRSLLFFGSVGTGVPCYGQGTADPTLDGMPTGEGDIYCYDPTNNDKGTHAYPYVYQVWAYDALELLAATSGAKNPWEVIPYAVWYFDLPFENDVRAILGAAWDAASDTLYLSQAGGDTDGLYYDVPLVHAFHVDLN